MTLLDRPVWSSLSTTQLNLGQGDERARRYLADINLFASARDDSEEALAALSALVDPGTEVYVLQVPPITLPPELVLLEQALGVQMVFEDADLSSIDTSKMLQLGDADAPEMLDLATLTEPGPFLRRTHHMGRFWGVRIDGRLAAMAGERMRFAGYTEVSAVCTHPDFRSRGLARRLSAHVAQLILKRGETPFLHSWATNHAAIALYQSLGFRVRCPVNVMVLERPASQA
jgi:predicted GNAT family acetyltransferase